MKKSSNRLFLTGLLLLVIGVILDLIMIFGGKMIPHFLTTTLAIGAQLISLISVYILFKFS
ncbi:hypothetical protein AO468_05590 [Oenococcus oeni]|nr:hypothetical protein ATW86_01950 [Oenococcus oeni]PDH74536.1 hypothetical protein AO499_05265 [Oenococcus oeni]PDH89078.1 hypothetical protein AO463_07115 [Oenococcus oeni]PDH89638.1 hypothetical protein AO466_04495 [Oenococcus oeni]PDH90524.1 hypothetical protein AO467_00915 [Oenococcus oeni]